MYKYKLKFQNLCLKYLANLTIIYIQISGYIHEHENHMRASQSACSPRLLSYAHECKIHISPFLLSQMPLRINGIITVYNNISNRAACKCSFRETSGGFCYIEIKAFIRKRLVTVNCPSENKRHDKRVLSPRWALQTLTPITIDLSEITLDSVSENPLIAINNILLVAAETEYSVMHH